jgi:hypothetical protein
MNIGALFCKSKYLIYGGLCGGKPVILLSPALFLVFSSVWHKYIPGGV